MFLNLDPGRGSRPVLRPCARAIALPVRVVRLFGAAGNNDKGPQDIARRELQSVFPSVFDTLVHIYRIDTVWFLAMQQRIDEIIPASRRILEETRGMDLRRLEEHFRVLSDQYKSFLSDIDAEAVSAYPHPQFGTLYARYIDIVRHVVNHGTYHRGNIAAMLRQLGHPGVPTDYVFYLQEIGAP